MNSSRQFPARIHKPELALGLALLLTQLPCAAQSPPNGTTVFRCIDPSGVVNFADAPCNHSASTRLRIQHSVVQSAPISMAEQQRLNALEQRLDTQAQTAKRRAAIEQKRRRLERQASTDRCQLVRETLADIRKRKRLGYPLSQAKRIDREEQLLDRERYRHCRE